MQLLVLQFAIRLTRFSNVRHVSRYGDVGFWPVLTYRDAARNGSYVPNSDINRLLRAVIKRKSSPQRFAEIAPFRLLQGRPPRRGQGFGRGP